MMNEAITLDIIQDHGIMIYTLLGVIGSLIVWKIVSGYLQDLERRSARYPVIMGIASGNPEYKCTQEEALAYAEKAKNIESVRGILGRIYENSKIGSRYFCIPDFTPAQGEASGESKFFGEEGRFEVPIEKRLAMFKRKAIPLVSEVCEKAISSSGVDVKDIEKLIVVSSTGFIGPGLDCELIKRLGLRKSADRSLIGFMGCAAAMNGFRVAMDYVRCHPGKHALVVCVELSSVHTTFEDNINDAILHAIFGDGCAAAVIGSMRVDEMPAGTLAIVDDAALLMEGTEDGITLSVNENGISCTLSKYLPTYISKNIGSYVDGWLSRHGLEKKDVDFWGVHPGGRRIIEEARNGLGLRDDQVSKSWDILREYGNMLSPSVMFILERILLEQKEMVGRGEEGHKTGLAFSFSPGVGVEGIMLRQVC